jgi:hypothetical protein
MASTLCRKRSDACDVRRDQCRCNVERHVVLGRLESHLWALKRRGNKASFYAVWTGRIVGKTSRFVPEPDAIFLCTIQLSDAKELGDGVSTYASKSIRRHDILSIIL